MKVEPYLIPSESVVFDEEIKKSHFITYLSHTPNVDAAKAFIESIKQKHADARHNCWAFIAGRPEDSMRWGFSDDGEPSGTAGKPILAQLSGSGIGEISAVVTRYFGGIRLGTGGLVKAYGGGVQQALKQIKTTERKITTRLMVSLDYGFVAIYQALLNQFDGKEVNVQYAENVVAVVELEVLNVVGFSESIINRSGAKALITRFEEK